MSGTITRDDFARMIAGAAASIRAQHNLLSELDCATGDGDHGSTMLRAVERLERSFAPGGPEDLKVCLREAGWSVLGVDGGASSSLLGTFFGGMADAPACNEPIGTAALAEIFEAGLKAVQKQTKAQPGDKTMMDALVPAVQALHAAADAGKSVMEALHDAAKAARAGAEATREFTARHGRAKFLGEKTRGHPDPGAVSTSLLFEGFSNGLGESKGESGNA
ncbi:MAG TPA: dihydroxyacetone kinase subunit DhaL [Bryobacteraceae bacterium]|nr:dihydroxyacetone kinase subunit DhaL [Bryobacteraceae bacterium]